MRYLVLHIDMEFIAGTICVGNGHTYPITNQKEDLLWLYFFNNPHQSHISFGKNNKIHYNNKEVNYYGNFFKEIEKEQETFMLRGIEHPTIDLLTASGLIGLIRKAYQEKTLDAVDQIPTLLTFSLSISDNAKQKTIDYLSKQGFDIKSYTIPVSELTCYHALHHKKLKVGNGSVALFLEATNTMLHLLKLTFSDNYFLKDIQTATYRGKGIDPRKRALVRFVVNEVNKSTGVLTTDDEKEDECERFEMQAEEWLKRLDAQNRNMPFRIPSVSFSKAPNMKKDVLVRKADLDSDTGQYTQELRDMYDAFKSDYVKGDVAVVFLLGNCFQSDRVKRSFENVMSRDRLFFYANEELQHILAMYPKIDINRYASEEARIKEQAKAEEMKQAAQRALEDQQRKEAAAAQQQILETQKAEQNRKEAQLLFERAFELEKNAKLQDALTNVENALLLAPGNIDYERFYNALKDKLRELGIQTEQYKSLLKKAELAMQSNDYISALHVYELAKDIFDSAEIRNTILEVKEKIKNRKQQEEKIRKLLSRVDVLCGNHQWMEAHDELAKILAMDRKNETAIAKSKAVDRELQKIEKQYKQSVTEADECLQSAQFDIAENLYKKALLVKPDDPYCTEQVASIPERKKLFEDEKKREAQEEAFRELSFDATRAVKKGNLSEALSLLGKALELKPEDAEIKARIKKIKFDMSFAEPADKPVGVGAYGKPDKKKGADDFWDKSQKIATDITGHTSKKETDDFWNDRKKEKTDDFWGEKKSVEKNKTTSHTSKTATDDFWNDRKKETTDDFWGDNKPVDNKNGGRATRKKKEEDDFFK